MGRDWSLGCGGEHGAGGEWEPKGWVRMVMERFELGECEGYGRVLRDSGGQTGTRWV